MTRNRNSVFSCISWWACIFSDQYFKSQKHYLKPGYIIQLIAFQWDAPSSPDSSLLVKWVWLVRLHSPGPSPVEGYEHNTISDLIAVLYWSLGIIKSCHMPNPNLYIYANYNRNFCTIYSNWSVWSSLLTWKGFILGNSRPANFHGFTMSFTISMQVS